MGNSQEVRFIHDHVIKLNLSDKEQLLQEAKNNPSGKMRYCLHENEDAALQEMLFVIPKGTISRPHKHADAAETHVVIEGEGTCVLFDDNGNTVDSFRVGNDGSQIYRIEKNIYHMLIPESDQLMIFETRIGKFNLNTNIFPDWIHESIKNR